MKIAAFAMANAGRFGAAQKLVADRAAVCEYDDAGVDGEPRFAGGARGNFSRMVGEAEMSGAKQEILKRVRAAIGQAEPPVLPLRNYRQSGVVSLADFIEKLRDYNVEAFTCTEADLPQAISEAIAVRHKYGLVIPPGIPDEWFRYECDYVRDTGLSHAELDAADGVLTCCTVAIAMTGTIILTHSEMEGRRALTLIPDYHLCIVRADQVVETVPEGIRRLCAISRQPSYHNNLRPFRHGRYRDDRASKAFTVLELSM